MFLALNNILGLQPPRHAEQNDTRQDIQRHDPEFERRKNKKQQPNEDLFDEENSATISVEALRVFLNEFLKSLSPSENQINTEQDQASLNEQLKQQPQERPQHKMSGNAAYAANSYQHNAQSRQKTSILGEVNENNADLISLEAADIRIIHTLLDDLKTLSEKNIEYIKIERASSFLQSLSNAVNIVKKSDIFKT